MISNAHGQSTGYLCKAYWGPKRCFPEPVCIMAWLLVADLNHHQLQLEGITCHRTSTSWHIRKWSSPNGQLHSNSLNLFDGETSTALTSCVFRPNPQRRNSWAIDVPKLGVVAEEAFQIVGVLAHCFSTQRR